MRRFRDRCVMTPILIGFIMPSLIIFVLEVFVGRISPFASLMDIAYRQFASGHNLFLLALFGLIPFVILSTMLLVLASRLPRRRMWCLCISGLIGILGLMIPAHASVWLPLYTRRHMSSTAVVAFIFIPFFCTVTLLIGLAVGWLVSLAPWFQRGGEPVAYGV